MPLAITDGFFRLGFTDYYAILGVPLGADTQWIRQSYLAIARRLHPDSCPLADPAMRELTTTLFSKLASPAYQKLNSERNRREYDLTLKLKIGQAIEERLLLKSLSPSAQRVATNEMIEAAYLGAVRAIAPTLYADPMAALARIGELSEINLAYLLRRRGQLPAAGTVSLSPPPALAELRDSLGPPPHPQVASSGVPGPASVPSSDEADNRVRLVAGYLRRAQEYLERGAYAQATLELRDALRIAPTNSRCHSLQGLVYLRQNQPTMAKVHVRKALSLDASNPEALEGCRLLEQMGHKIDLTPPNPNPATKSASAKGGLFGGLFGGKRK
jgi:tetratricopeptide (TPR) repeat protein